MYYIVYSGLKLKTYNYIENSNSMRNDICFLIERFKTSKNGFFGTFRNSELFMLDDRAGHLSYQQTFRNNS